MQAVRRGMPEDGRDGLNCSRLAQMHTSSPLEPASHAQGLDLNVASSQEISDLCGLGPDRARSIVNARPLYGWDDVARTPGFTPELIRQLQHAGARIGGPGGGGDRPGRDNAE